MNFTLTEKQEHLVSKFRVFGENNLTPSRIRQWRKDQGLPDEVVKEFVDLYFGPEELYDGETPGSFNLTSQTLIIQELSRCAGTTLPFQNDLFNLRIIEEFANANEFSSVVKDYGKTGRLTFAMAISEPQTGSDIMNMQTCTRTVDGKLTLNGCKVFVNNGEYAPYFLVAAIDKDDKTPHKYPPMAFWFLPRNLDGIKTFPTPKIGQSMLPFATVSFDDVEILPEYRLTGQQGGFKQLFRLLEFGRVFICASSLGMAQAAMEDAVKHAKTRSAFDVQIGKFQQIEQMLTDMELRLYNMSGMLYRAAEEITHEAPSEQLTVALMKRYIPRSATKVADSAMQILGGKGYTEPCRISHLWQDCRGNQIAVGTDEIMVYIAAPLILNKY